jgi:hypothetical protein
LDFIMICHSLKFSNSKNEEVQNKFITPHVRGRMFYS